MGQPLTPDPAADLRAAKDRLASLVLGGDRDVDPVLGTLRLRPHQISAVRRLLEVITRHRGALLADAVGLGKTYVALAIARRHSRPLIVCPAALRPMWERATSMARLDIAVVSIESLASDNRPESTPDLVIVDEAHHFRTPKTKRYAALAAVARRARVLLISATPLHNSRRDLDSLLGLFVGSSVAHWTDAAIARLIVRRDAAAADQVLPRIDGPHPVSPGRDDDCLGAILALPPSIPAADEGVAHALTTISLVHLWASSRAALLASARKRRARAVAMREAIVGGHVPTAAELSAWQFAEGSLQLAFPFCAASTGEMVDVHRLAGHLDMYAEATKALIDGCLATPDPDHARADLLRALLARHAGSRVIAFSQYANTVMALGALMRNDRGVAVITAEGGRISSGRITRSEILAQFAGDAPAPRAIERIDLLLTTDLLSEGIDLRGASVVVHLDLPWNPARLEQRVGRARRIGSRHEVIHVYTFVPPTEAERMLELERRLTRKVCVANRVVGGADHPIGTRGSEVMPSPVSAAERLRARASSWIDPSAREEAALVTAAARSPVRGCVGAVIVDGLPRVVYCRDGIVGDDAAICDELLSGMGEAIAADPALRDESLRAVGEWLGSRTAVSGVAEQSVSKRAVLERLAETVSRAPRHRRQAIVTAAHRARASLAAVSGIGAEHILATLARSPADDEAWVQSVEAFGALHSADTVSPGGEAAVAVLILLM